MGMGQAAAAAAVLLGTREWAEEHDLPVLARFVDAESAAVDYVHGHEGLLDGGAVPLVHGIVECSQEETEVARFRQPAIALILLLIVLAFNVVSRLILMQLVRSD